jgi:uroporphyrin-III C-methyltransferase/precorrin-2 dehydrogenase/sirohydrochlorin ferrochelatase/uroporphyrin-III C-methyltransferase
MSRAAAMVARPVVHLMGAGPGDPELLTLKAARVLAAAEVVVHDRLVGEGVLAMVRPGARLIAAGKSTGAHTLSQDDINRLLLGLAQPARTVVRLKGGDPFVFGRGGEEALFLMRHGVEVEVVPGVTAAAGCAASLKVPLTHRGLATGVRFVTGHCREGWWLDLDWRGLADPETTLVVYMGLGQLEEITSRLIEAGLTAGTPAVAVEAATTLRERAVWSSLAGLNTAVRTAGLQPPTLVVIGRVVAVLHQATEGTACCPADALLEHVIHA